MAEYIEREALIKDFQTNGSVFVYGVSTINAIVSRINRQPAADVVEVVRCRDCKNYTNADVYKGKFSWRFCDKFNNVTKETDFCSYGKRKDGAK